MPKVDLHLHSSVSDGTLSPAELIEKAASLGLTTIALTDHDNVDGIAPALEAAEKYPVLTCIPGVEISTDIDDGEVHMLGYFIDHTNKNLRETLENMQNARLLRAQRMVERLNRLGLDITWDRVREIAGHGTVGRPHVAQALLEKGYIDSINEAFVKYLAFKGPAYVRRPKMTPEESIDLIRRANGLAVLAHPYTKGSRNPEKLIARLVPAGLAGLEAHYREYPQEQRSGLVALAEKYGLVTTGGSDYHGLNEKSDIMMGEANVPPGIVDDLTALLKKNRMKTNIATGD